MRKIINESVVKSDSKKIRQAIEKALDDSEIFSSELSKTIYTIIDRENLPIIKDTPVKFTIKLSKKGLKLNVKIDSRVKEFIKRIFRKLKICSGILLYIKELYELFKIIKEFLPNKKYQINI